MHDTGHDTGVLRMHDTGMTQQEGWGTICMIIGCWDPKPNLALTPGAPVGAVRSPHLPNIKARLGLG